MKFSSLTLLGSTGSIGTQTLDVLRQLGGRIRVAGLSAAGTRLELLASQVDEFRPEMVHIADPERVEALKARLPRDWRGSLLSGAEGLKQIAAQAPADLVLVATVGWTGLEPALAAIKAGRHIALANKEVLVCGGHLVTREATRQGVELLPVDSEHNAIHQCLCAAPTAEIRRLILTCSGGPFLRSTKEEIDNAPREATLNHPTWNMGEKVTVDSATLMNKGLEVIEAHHLFHVPYKRIEVVIHPQSIVHSMVEFLDGSIIAQLGPTDMRLPIQYAVTFPERHPTEIKSLDLAALGTLSFEPPDLERFPCLEMAYRAGEAGGSAPAVLNGANEVAVRLHLEGKIPCGEVSRIVQSVVENHEPESDPSMERLRQWDTWARQQAEEAAAKRTPMS